MYTNTIKSYWKAILVLVCLGTLVVVIPVLVSRGLHGEYGIDINGLNILFLTFLPFIALYLISIHQTRYFNCCSCLLALLLSFGFVLFYLVSNGLWCAQHPNVMRELCAKLNQFASFAHTANVTSWWLTLGDLLAIERGRDMPMAWEHDIDVCITPEQYPIFEKALKARPGSFNPEPETLKPGHLYLPVDMAKLGLRNREAEGVIIDVWTCPQLSGNITRMFYCNGLMNVPSSVEERHKILTKEYGNYSVVTYEHHSFMCKIWNG